MENQVRQEYLRELKCGFAQGYHIAQPLPGDNAEMWLKRADFYLE